MNILHVAKVCHQVNRAFCMALGDSSQQEWENAPEWQKNSALDGVKFRLANPIAPPSASHESWLRNKLDNGWKYGPIKDEQKKEHPCIVDYEQLPVEQKAKDYLFIAVVDSLKGFLQD